MKRKTLIKSALPILTAVSLMQGAGDVQATPYASGLTNTAGTVSFFLNEDADNVKVVLNNGAGGTNNMGALVRGKYNFSLGANTTYRIEVTKASGAGYKSTDGTGTNAVALQISSSTNRYLNFENPRGLEVNRNPSSPFFGRIYGGSGTALTTAAGRPMGIGIYMINPDLSSAHPAGLEDTPLTGGLGMNGTSFPYELTIGPDDNLYVIDWTDSSGNLWVTDPEVSGVLSAPVLKLLSAAGTAVNPVGIDNTHGSVNAAHVEGSLAAGNLKVWTIDEDLQTDKTTTTKTELNSLWRYDVDANPLPYVGEPVKVWTPTGKQGISSAAQTMDMVRSTNGNFYVTDQRSTGNESGLAVFDASGTPLWNSWQASQAIRAGVDFLANSIKVAVSPDNKYIAVARSSIVVWIIPLANGIPDLTQRRWLNTFTGSTIRGLSFDAAGNLYVSNNGTEFIRIFSPGGSTVAITSNDNTGTNGTFAIETPATSVSVTAAIASITESGGTNGTFTVTRTGDTSGPLNVTYSITGTATNGVDYATSAGGTVTFAAFQSSTNLNITPTPDAITEATETIVLSLSGGSGYSVGSPGSAIISILDDETPQVSFTPVAAKKLLESYAPSKATFQLTRLGLLNTNLTVNIGYSGATPGVDFSGATTVSIPANASTANLTLTSVDDQAYEGTENLVLSVTAGTGYVPGTNTATATILDDEYPAGALLFSDNFETTNSALAWAVSIADPADGSADFAFNYGDVGIPPAPGASTTLGLRFTLSRTINQINAVSASPLNGNFTGNYRLKFNMWINYNGPMPDGGAGSTQNFDAGVGTTGDRVVWRNNPDSDGVWFTTTGDGADGNTGGDYNAFIGPNVQNDDSGFYAAGTGTPNSGIRDNANAYYAVWGGQAAPAAQLALYPGQSGVANIGNAGMAWHTVVITKANDTVTWAMDGVVIATVTNDPITLSTNIFVGYQDLFASGSVSDNPDMSFGLLDNLRVETYVAAQISITGIKVVGGNVEVSFTAGASNVAGDFKLQSATTVNGTYSDENSAALSSPGSGAFKATIPVPPGNRFYRIKM